MTRHARCTIRLHHTGVHKFQNHHNHHTGVSMKRLVFCAELGCKPNGWDVGGASVRCIGTNGWQPRWLWQRRRTTPQADRRLPQSSIGMLAALCGAKPVAIPAVGCGTDCCFVAFLRTESGTDFWKVPDATLLAQRRRHARFGCFGWREVRVGALRDSCARVSC